MNIGFIGLGVMGKSMALHLLTAGHTLFLYNRTKEKAQDLLDKGAKWEDSPSEVTKQSQVVITIVGYPKDVEEIYFGKKGIFQSYTNQILIDMTTSSPNLTKEIYSHSNGNSLDAPVSGGDKGAKEAILSIMVGGSEDIFLKAKPLFVVMGENIVYQGKTGSGQHTKMCNQIAIASGMIGVAESLAYAKKSGLNPYTVLQSIESGAAASWSLSNLAPRALENDYAPGFYVKHFLKDMNIALQSAQELNLDLPGLQLTKKIYESIKDADDFGTQILCKYYFEKS